MGWTWRELQSTPEPVVAEILELMKEDAEDAEARRREIEAIRAQR